MFNVCGTAGHWGQLPIYCDSCCWNHKNFIKFHWFPINWCGKLTRIINWYHSRTPIIIIIIYIYTYCNHIVRQWSTKHHKLPILCCWNARHLRPWGPDLLLRHLGTCQDVAPRSAKPETRQKDRWMVGKIKQGRRIRGKPCKMVHSLGPWDIHQEKLTKKT